MGRFINSIYCKDEMHPFPAQTNIRFQDGINLIVGDQGTGKSTLLELIMQAHTSLKGKVILDEDTSSYGYFYFNSELHNPRSMSAEFGMDRYDITLDNFITNLSEKLSTSRLTNAQLFMNQVWATYNKVKNEGKNLLRNKLSDLDVLAKSAVSSHGQALIPFLEEITKYPNSIVILDEPETALSVKSQYYLHDLMMEAVNNGCQIICCTHSELLMVQEDLLLCLDGDMPEWIPSVEHIARQHEDRVI